MTSIGLHHVTAISGPARQNLSFYREVLGLRLVKKTVNFDDPGTYHLYYGDETGQPGTIMTFFPWDRVASGRIGAGETQETAFQIPATAIAFWSERLATAGIAFQRHQRFGETALTLADPDGLPLALIATDTAADLAGYATSAIPAEHAIRGFQGVTLLVREADRTAAILTDVFGLTEAGREPGTDIAGRPCERLRYRAEGPALGAVVDLLISPSASQGRMGGGSVHHIAFRAADDAQQEAMVARLAAAHGIHTTEQRDRNYFRSVYFREPSGVLFEIATDIPGFAVDEPVASLGETLKLPAGLEASRARIEQVLPALT